MGHLQKLLVAARLEGRAVAAFNAVDVNTMWAVLSGGRGCDVPVIVQMSQRTAEFWGASFIAETFARLRRDTMAEAVLHLDHCRSISTAVACLDAGWDSVLLDVSALEFADGVDATRSVVEFANDVDADVEGEFDAIPTTGGKDLALSDPDRCREFVAATGVACLAPALGTAHGRPGRTPRLDVSLVEEIERATQVPLVLHGGTGLTPAQVREVASAGVAKVNFSTAVKERYLHVCADQEGSGDDPSTHIRRIREVTETLVSDWVTALR